MTNDISRARMPDNLPRLKLISAMLGREFEEMKCIEQEAVAQIDAPKKPAFLSARGLGRRAFMNPIDFDIAEGEVLGLAGLLGSGRTETAKMLFGIVPADSGETQIKDRATTIRSPSPSRR